MPRSTVFPLKANVELKTLRKMVYYDTKTYKMNKTHDALLTCKFDLTWLGRRTVLITGTAALLRPDNLSRPFYHHT